MIKIDKYVNSEGIKLYFDDGGSLCIFTGPTGNLYFKPLTNLVFNFDYKGDVPLYINKNDDIYKYFDKLYKDIEKYHDEDLDIINDGKISVFSESFKKEYASSLSLIEEDNDMKLVFNCSSEPYSFRSYFVMVKNEKSIYFPYNEMFIELFHSIFENSDDKVKQKVLK